MSATALSSRSIAKVDRDGSLLGRPIKQEITNEGIMSLDSPVMNASAQDVPSQEHYQRLARSGARKFSSVSFFNILYLQYFLVFFFFHFFHSISSLSSHLSTLFICSSTTAP